MGFFSRSLFAVVFTIICSTFSFAQNSGSQPNTIQESTEIEIIQQSGKDSVRTIPTSPSGDGSTLPQNTQSSGTEVRPALTQNPSSGIKVVKPGAPLANDPSIAVVKPENRDLATKVPFDDIDFEELLFKRRPALVISGESSWMEQIEITKKNIALLNETAKEKNIPVIGFPFVVFVETRENSFLYEMMLPIEKIPDPEPELANSVKLGYTPEGTAFRFSHNAPYETIESLYETISAFLDGKGISAKDTYLEEYMSELKSESEEPVSVNIYIFPK